MNSQTESNYFYALRGLAIISVAYAHSLSLSNETLQRIGASLGVIGVPLFLVCSGFYFKQEKWTVLATKLARGIISPWIIWGTIAFLLSVLLGAVSSNLLSLVAFLSGHGTWLYYIPVYIIVRCIYNCNSSVPFLISLIWISIASNIVSFTPPSQLASVSVWCTPWQNPLNWLGFFALGIIIKRFGIFITFSKSRGIEKVFFGILSIVIFVLLVTIPMKINYWNPFAVVLEYLSTLTLIGAGFISKSNILKVLGQNSLLIYLLHIQIGIASANIIFRLIQLPDIILLIVKPFMVIAITMLLIYSIRAVVGLFKLNGYSQYLGLYCNISK